ncbi:MAG: capsule assembly Wzi family protein [Deltaproteobacteria bacterium]|nr:capsule assembly Wzi family protein [Deltaproteobacteria bacterium]NCP03914.1 capsule assembly Wzi family protein [Deltaproteobacteria bacterium]
MKLRVLILCLWLLPGLPIVSATASPVSPSIPLDSWVYPALDKLAGFAQFDSNIQGLKPLSRHEVARRVALLRQELALTDALPVALELIEVLERELEAELAELSKLAPTPAWRIEPMNNLGTYYVFRDGPASIFHGSNARQFALDVNRDGRDGREQSNFEFSWTSRVRIGQHLMADWHPRIDWQEGSEGRLRTTTGQIALAAGPVTLSAGRQSLWWGPGQNGSLLLTNNAKPLEMLRLHSPESLTLPWLFKFIGPFQFDLFLSRLESEREVPNPNLLGLRFNFKPTRWLELGAARVVMFGGEGTPTLDFGDYLTILSGRNLDGGEDTSNSLAAVDFRLTLPWTHGLQLYGELGGEDEANHLPSKIAFLAGIYLPRFTFSGRFDLRIEYADLSPPGRGGAVWYRHGLYRSGYTYHGKIIGHHAGGDAQDLWVESRAFLPGGVSLAINFESLQRGISQPIQEKHYRPGFELRWRIKRADELRFTYSYDHVEKFDFREQSANLNFAMLGYTHDW